MLVLNPSKYSWYIGIIFSLLVFFLLTVFNYFELQQKDGLIAANGVLQIKKIKKTFFPVFLGDGVVGVCKFKNCMSDKVVSMDGKNVSVKLDSENKIFEITSGGQIIFGKNDIDHEVRRHVFQALICLVFLLLCLIALLFERKKYVS